MFRRNFAANCEGATFLDVQARRDLLVFSIKKAQTASQQQKSAESKYLFIAIERYEQIPTTSEQAGPDFCPVSILIMIKYGHQYRKRIKMLYFKLLTLCF